MSNRLNSEPGDSPSSSLLCLPPGHLSSPHNVWFPVSLEVPAFLCLPMDPAVYKMCGFLPLGPTLHFPAQSQLSACCNTFSCIIFKCSSNPCTRAVDLKKKKIKHHLFSQSVIHDIIIDLLFCSFWKYSSFPKFPRGVVVGNSTSKSHTIKLVYNIKFCCFKFVQLFLSLIS